MEDKLLEILESNTKNLNKDKEQLSKAIEDETRNGKVEIKDGKFDKSSLYYEYKQDLTKIEKELDSIAKEREKIIEKQQKEKNISLEKEKLKKLNKDKEQCEQAITEEQKLYSFSDGKFDKTPALLEYQKDLDKINNELNSKMTNILKQEKELETLNSYIEQLANKYNVKEKLEQEKVKENEKLRKEKSDKKDELLETKIKKVQDEMEKENRNYSGIDLESEPYVGKASLNKPESKLKNTFEIENAINNVYRQMQNDNRDVKNIHLDAINPNIEIPKEKILKNKIKYIEILEANDNIIYIDEKNEEHILPIQEALEDKKEKFKKLGISEICNEIAGGRIKGALLKRKINPEIVGVLKNNKEQLKEYINCIYEKKELPFELTHDLTNLNVLQKFKLNKYIKSEEKIGAKILGKMFDKNRTLKSATQKVKDSAIKVKDVSKEKYNNAKSKGKEFIQKIPNKDSQLELKAQESLKQKESEKELADNVKRLMEEKSNDR